MVGRIGYAIGGLPPQEIGLRDAAARELDRSGASNPVTAVLLNYRSYDTLLEMTVLLLAVLAALALVGGPARETSPTKGAVNPVLRGFVRVLTPVAMLVAGHLLWLGSHAPGGAFQAGAVLASAGVLLVLAEIDWSRGLPAWAERCLLTVGLATFLVVGVGVTVTGARYLEYPPELAKWLILVIEAPCGISIAAALIAVFLGGRLRFQQPFSKEREP